MRSVIWRIEAVIYDAVAFVLNLLPFGFVSWLGGKLIGAIGPLTSKNDIAKTGLNIAFPDKSEAERQQILRSQWNNIGRTFAEFPITHKIKPFTKHARVTVIGLEHFKAAAPCVIVTGHFANWEVMAAVLTATNLPVRITYRKINNPYIDRRVRRQREKYGTKFLVQKSGVKGARELFEALKAGDSIALLNDQKFNTGLSIPFFGEPAMTAPGAVRLALKTQRPLLPISIVRDGANFVVTFHAPLDLNKTNTRDADTKAGVQQVTQFIEDRIREQPDQWFWVHRRWPKPLYKRTP